MTLQPLLHDLLVAAMAPTQAWSGQDGQIRSLGAQGVFHADTRVLSSAVLTVADDEPETVAAGPAGPGAVQVVSVLRGVDVGGGADPTVRLRRTRLVMPGTVRETLEITTAAPVPVTVPLALRLACDLAEMGHVKAGGAADALAATWVDGVLEWTARGDRVTVTGGGPAPGDASARPVVDLTDPAAPVLAWLVTVRPGAPVTVWWELRATPSAAPVVQAPPAGPTWSTPEIDCDDNRVRALVDQALDDLGTLRMSATFAPNDVFLAAGAPWFFTLFGRDSIWAARMMLPLGTDLAAGTLRTLALRQGTSEDAETAEQPGKILHEVRSKALSLGEHGELPPLYYGTVDATPLWICLLHDAWRWGMPTAEVEELLPAMEAALRWMADYGDADGDGFLEYLDTTGHGLANQGWKDSGDSVQWRDGSLATGPIALCEVQGYAHEAALAAAEMLDAFGRPGAARWRQWAADLAAHFRQSFWVSDDEGRYPAIALDAEKRAVDTLTSNIGHLLGTGLLNADEESLVARRLGSAALDSGYGLRTMASGSAGYWPMSYHGGAVWTHDTAIAVAGLVRGGSFAVATGLLEGLLAAAADFDYRVPELHSGDAKGSVPTVVPYPAACRPQAWSAASAVVLLSAVLGIRPDVPGGTISLVPMTPSPVGALRVTGLQVAGRRLDVEIDRTGAVRSVQTDARLRPV
ncbi:glycogen debranching N-terminal domain-containing protein [Cellulomonas sp. KRMCY2]|uniref:glycogen debranching N-terminal domain-containing protein n=1 Tax=Cellulomonas sp. KRMCY2 TaxID=1304865 RepID=UPI00045E8B64|nr:glycogen debranching N-terminal domain-containing protein [Cellulomonas sp. KRMCY2]